MYSFIRDFRCSTSIVVCGSTESDAILHFRNLTKTSNVTARNRITFFLDRVHFHNIFPPIANLLYINLSELACELDVYKFQATQ